MTTDDRSQPSAAPRVGVEPGGTLPPPIEEIRYEPVSPLRKFVMGFLATAAIVGLLAAVVLFAFPRPPAGAVRVVRQFVEAVNAGDFSRQYALLAPAEPLGPQGADIPLLDEGELKVQLTSAVEPSFFSGIQIGTNFSERRRSTRGKHTVWQFNVPLTSMGTAPQPLAGQRPRYISILVDVTQPPYRIFAFGTYSSFYFNNYSMETHRKFNRILLQRYGTEAPSLPPPGAAPQ